MVIILGESLKKLQTKPKVVQNFGENIHIFEHSIPEFSMFQHIDSALVTP